MIYEQPREHQVTAFYKASLDVSANARIAATRKEEWLSVGWLS